MFATVLLAVDLAHEASWRKALPAAAEIARRGGGKLHVVAVAPDFAATLVGGFFPEDFEAKALAHVAEELAAFVAAHGPKDVPVETHAVHGHVAEEILRVAKESGAELIVMASHQPNQLREFFIGSNADRVVRHSPVSVLVVRDDQPAA
jgi:nucleotide-binding universal stress UspA family protein